MEPRVKEELMSLYADGARHVAGSGLSTEQQVEDLAEVAAAMLDAATDTGPLEEIDGELFSRSIFALGNLVRSLGERDPVKIRARADRAEAAGHHARAARRRARAALLERS